MNPARGVSAWLGLGAAFCLLCWFHLPRAAAQPSQLVAGQSYSDLAQAALLKRAQEISAALSNAGLIPVEPTTNADVTLEGRSTYPSGAVALSACRYEFRDGLISGIRRTDLFEDKGPESLILRHLTNELLTLNIESASARALEVMSLLSYDPARIRATHRVNAADNLMDAYPLRNGGPNFPKDLRFYGELVSRKKIKMVVTISPRIPDSAKDKVFSPGTQIDFLATSGELLEVSWLPNQPLAKLLDIPAPEPIAIPQTADFGPPVFVEVSRRIPGAVSNITADAAQSLVSAAWAELKSKAGTNSLKGVLVCDNLNQPAAIAETLNHLCVEIPWAGVLHTFKMVLPFDASRIERLVANKRGVALLGVAGPVDLQFDLTPDLSVEETFHERVQSDEANQHYESIREKFAPQVDPLLARLTLSNGLPDHIIFLFQPMANFASSVVSAELEKQLRGQAQVVSLMGTADGWSVGPGQTYFRGKVYSNAIALVHLSGHLPLQPDHFGARHRALARLSNSPAAANLRMLQARVATRIISGEVHLPFRQLAYSFGPHPLEDVVAFFGDKWVRFLQTAQRLEVLRISQVEPRIQIGSSVQVLTNTGPKTVEGYNLLKTGKTLDSTSARELADAVLDEKNGHLLSACFFDPGVIFQIWNGEEYARLVVCFTCSEFELTFYDSKGKPLRNVFSHFVNRSELLKLALRGLPADQDLEMLDRPQQTRQSSTDK